MPNLNLPDEERPSPRPPVQPMMPRERGGMMGRMLIIFGAVVLVVLAVVILNALGVIHLWGEKPAETHETFAPPAEVTAPADTTVAVAPPPAPVGKQPALAEKKPAAKQKEPPPVKPTIKPGTGEYTLIAGSYRNRKSAEEVVELWTEAGYESFVTASRSGGQKWYRVGVGRYGTRQEAVAVGKKMAQMFEEGYWVGRIE